jgi:hypothetical protein
MENTPNSSDEKFYTDYFIWQVVYKISCRIYIIMIWIK